MAPVVVLSITFPSGTGPVFQESSLGQSLIDRWFLLNTERTSNLLVFGNSRVQLEGYFWYNEAFLFNIQLNKEFWET